MQSLNLPDLIRQAWEFVASISFRSVDRVAAATESGAAMDALRQLALVNFTPKQRETLGPSRVSASLLAQARARGLAAPQRFADVFHNDVLPWIPCYCGDRLATSDGFASSLGC